jgi:phosphogluconate dehydratase
MVTDGRMSGASGKVPAAIHVTPECLAGGPLAKVRDGDIIRLDTRAGTLQALVDDAEWRQRQPAAPRSLEQHGMGRELFAVFRAAATGAEDGARTFGLSTDDVRDAATSTTDTRA